ncbi:hypothetical protein GIB67_038371 [Kingdonia uniflora]|uniref:Rhodanese domain-containing protein n=1 Tax=Kingdonia uniflora TaxID=39325 RepID=A0A7J7NPH3_9MAGN|nr:hypothetical protein GIB67_038371 [Kingdonia uniflora]
MGVVGSHSHLILFTWIILFCEILLIFLYFSSSEPDVVTADVHRAKDLVRSGHRYIDVRTVEEFNIGHADVENPLNIPYMFNTPQGRVKNFNFWNRFYFLARKMIIWWWGVQILEANLWLLDWSSKTGYGCQSGVRSLCASDDLLNADFRHVSNMGGGYAEWVENGLGVKKPKAEL